MKTRTFSNKHRSEASTHRLISIVLLALISATISPVVSAATAGDDPLSLQFVCSSDNNNATLRTKEIDKYFIAPSAPMIEEIVESENCHIGQNGLIIGSSTAPGSLIFSLKKEYRKNICRIILQYIPFEFYIPSVSICNSASRDLQGHASAKLYSEYFEFGHLEAENISIGSSEKICVVAMTIVYADSEAAKGEVTSVKVPLASRTLNVGEKSGIQAIVMPEYALDKTLIYESDNNGVATVDNEGMITAVSVGRANVYVRSKSTPSVVAVVAVDVVEIKPVSIRFADGERTVGVGGRLNLELIFEPSAASKDVVWSTDYDEFIDLDQNGTVTGIKECPILNVRATSRVDESVYKYCVLKVIDHLDVSSVSVNPPTASLEVGGMLRVHAEVLPSGASNKAVEWSTTDERVAVVDKSGVVTATGSGQCLISAVATDGSGAESYCSVTVEDDDVASVESISAGDDENMIQCFDNTIILKSSDTDAPLVIVDLDGRRYFNGKLLDGCASITLPGGHVYILSVGKSRYKVML